MKLQIKINRKWTKNSVALNLSFYWLKISQNMNRCHKKSPGRVNQGLNTSERWKPTHKCSKIKKPHSMWSFSTRGGTWTRTPQRAQDFKSGVSTNSTTRAFVLKRTVEVERETGFEPATPTLARLCSTNWATLAYFNDATFDYVAGDKFINILWFFSREWHNISHKLAIIWTYNWLFLFDLWHN